MSGQTTALTTIDPGSKQPDMPLAQLGEVFARSGFFSDSRDAAKAIVKILAGRELGLAPLASMMGIYIVKGRVSLSANLMAVVIRRQGAGCDYRITEHTDEACAIEFTREGKVLGVSRFTMEDAKRAGLAKGDNWQHYPRNMLFARAMSNGAKWYMPELFGGTPVYTPEELGAAIDATSGEIVQDARSEPASDDAPPPTTY